MALFWIFTILIPVVIALELWGVYRKGGPDTITETYRWWTGKLPTSVRMVVTWLLAGFLVWAILHLAFNLV